MSPAAFGWWAIGIAVGGLATVIVARLLKVTPDSFIRREVPLALLAIPFLLLFYVHRSLSWSNELLNSRAFGTPDMTLRTVQNIILSPVNAARALAGPTIVTLVLASVALYLGSTPEERERNRRTKRAWLALAFIFIGLMVEMNIIW